MNNPRLYSELQELPLSLPVNKLFLSSSAPDGVFIHQEHPIPYGYDVMSPLVMPTAGLTSM